MTTTPSKVEVASHFFSILQGIGYVVGLLIFGVALFYALKSEIDILKIKVSAVQEDVSEIKSISYDNRLTAVEAEVVSLRRDVGGLQDDIRSIRDKLDKK